MILDEAAFHNWYSHQAALTRAPMGYSRTLPADRGGRPPSRAIYQNIGPILDPNTEFHSSGHELSEYVVKVHLKVTDDATGRIKGQIFNYLSLLASPGKAAVSN